MRTDEASHLGRPAPAIEHRAAERRGGERRSGERRLGDRREGQPQWIEPAGLEAGRWGLPADLAVEIRRLAIESDAALEEVKRSADSAAPPPEPYFQPPRRFA